jgi:type IV secretory pathway protease TraF
VSQKQDLRDALSERLYALAKLHGIDNKREVASYIAELTEANGNAVRQWLDATNLPQVPQMITLCLKTNLSLDFMYYGKVMKSDIQSMAKIKKIIRNRY